VRLARKLGPRAAVAAFEGRETTTTATSEVMAGAR
jgi:hypothetical protein